MADSLKLKAFIKENIDDPKKINNVGAMSSAAAKLLKDNDRDLEKAKKNFNKSSFMRDYNEAKDKIEKRREEKKMKSNE